MSVSKITNRYAKSLFDLAREKNILELVVEDARGFIEIAKNRKFSLLLKSPIIHAEKKWEVFEKIFGGKVHKETLNFFGLVIRKGRENILPQMMIDVVDDYNRLKGITTVTLTSATELSQKEFDRIATWLKQSKLATENVEFIKKIDPAIGGGFIIEIGDKLYDASIAGKIKKLKKELI